MRLLQRLLDEAQRSAWEDQADDREQARLEYWFNRDLDPDDRDPNGPDLREVLKKACEKHSVDLQVTPLTRQLAVQFLGYREDLEQLVDELWTSPLVTPTRRAVVKGLIVKVNQLNTPA